MPRRVITSFGYGDECSKLARISAVTFQRYAAAHGWDLFLPQKQFFSRAHLEAGRGDSWLKVPLIHVLLEDYDEVLWLDADVMAMRLDRDIADDLTDAPMHLVVHHTIDGEVPNCGVWHVRRQARDMVRSLWDRNQFRRSECWWEQAALIHALGGDPDAEKVRVNPSYLWSELPYEWNPHVADARGIPGGFRFFHATQVSGRQAVMERMLEKVR